MSASLPHIQSQSRLSEQILPRKSYVRDSAVSVSALLCKRNAVCVLCHLKCFKILPGGLFFGILRFRNIGLSKHWAVPPDQYLSNSVIVFTTNLSFILSNMMKFGIAPVRHTRVEFCSIISLRSEEHTSELQSHLNLV